MTKIKTDLDRAVRCLNLAEMIANNEAEITELQGQIAFSDLDDDSDELKRIAELQAQIESYKTEQQTLTDEMEDDVPLSDAVIAHFEK